MRDEPDRHNVVCSINPVKRPARRGQLIDPALDRGVIDQGWQRDAA